MRFVFNMGVVGAFVALTACSGTDSNSFAASSSGDSQSQHSRATSLSENAAPDPNPYCPIDNVNTTCSYPGQSGGGTPGTPSGSSACAFKVISTATGQTITSLTPGEQAEAVEIGSGGASDSHSVGYSISGDVGAVSSENQDTVSFTAGTDAGTVTIVGSFSPSSKTCGTETLHLQVS